MLNGGEFYYYYDGDNLCTVLKLADNSSWLEFSDWGFVNSLINRVDLQNKYNGGMCLGNFSYSDGSEIVSNLNSLSNSFSIAPILVGLVSALADSGMYVTGGAVGSVLMPYVLFALAVAQVSLILDSDCCVGEPDGYVDNYWRTHNMTDDPQIILVTEGNQINLNHQIIKEFKKSQEWNPDKINKDGAGGDGPDNKWLYLLGGGFIVIENVIWDIVSGIKQNDVVPNDNRYNLSFEYNKSDTKSTAILITKI